VFSEPYLHPWVFLHTVQAEGALVEQRAEPAKKGRTLREGSTEDRQSKPRLLS